MPQTSILHFYFNRNCPYAQRSWMTLLELGIDFEPVEIVLGKDNKTEWYLSINPNGTVPTIKHGETIVYESSVVNEYLCEVFDSREATLMPAESAARARVRALILRCDAKFVKLTYSYLSHKRQDNPVKDDQLQTQLIEELSFLDKTIGEARGTYFLGEKVSLVDLTYLPFFERQIVALSAWKNFELKDRNLPYLDQWVDSMFGRDSFVKTKSEPEQIKELYSLFLGKDYFKKVGVAE
ncbi:glutathione S-transferase family protein [Chroococcidiopsis sp. FACHB-1243]|uniref:glutathione S-transferase family protein n=1 Tax=Chroococcidiopsis sp. [FACHB-1243] TaxID=2692781 RepID=UPI00177C8D59|nr:glutathione S-transferase family protein [Chroococcidiopsis sp. [FACHB-1243]]MBD2305587.1 glutathione S-transferase family protein [Chroococcidiopsis sp. [FACHB-1243]]